MSEVSISENSLSKREIKSEVVIPQFCVFNLNTVKEQLHSDPVLALAALRIEIEKKLRLTAEHYNVPQRERYSIRSILEALRKKEILHSEQIEVINHIQHLCNKAIHGFEISYEDAKKIVDIAERLNYSFAIGYWINFEPNPDYEKMGLFCEWEHCIERYPAHEEFNENTCKVFGHECPGGVERVKKCGKTFEDFPISRLKTCNKDSEAARQRSISSKPRRKYRPSDDE